MAAIPVCKLRADQIPAQPTPSPMPLSSAATTLSIPTGVPGTPVNQAQRISAERANRDLVRAAALARYGGGGRCVCWGLGVALPGGLSATIEVGAAIGDGYVELAASPTLALLASSRTWLWLRNDGVVWAATSPAPPAGAAAFLGSVVTNGSGATEWDDSGVLRSSGGLRVRRTADRGAPDDAPPEPLATLVLGGRYDWDGLAHRPVGPTAYVGALAATLAMTSREPDILVLDPGSATRKVVLPASLPLGSRPFAVAHGGGAGLLQIRDPSDATTLLTLSPGGSTAPIVPKYDLASGAMKPPSTVAAA